MSNLASTTNSHLFCTNEFIHVKRQSLGKIGIIYGRLKQITMRSYTELEGFRKENVKCLRVYNLIIV